MKLVVGFLTYNESSAKYLPDFLKSLQQSLYFLEKSEYRVLAFDNSDNNSSINREELEKFNSSFSNFVEIFSTDNNLGFSRAYNILIRQAVGCQADYFLVVNPDLILDKEVLFHLCQALDKDDSLGSVSPKIRRWDFATNTKTKIIDSCGIVLNPGLRFSDLGQGEPDNKQFDKRSILGPSGAAGLFRVRSLQSIVENGYYFDENFFMYKEDCDLAYRLMIQGKKSLLVPEAIVYHDRTAAVRGRGVLSRIASRSDKSRRVRTWSFVNQHLLFIKHWQKENFISKMLIICQIVFFGIFSLILEQFLLKEYKNILKIFRRYKSID